MRTKVTLVLLFLNVALFFFIFKFERHWRTERASLEARRRVLGAEAADIRSLEITSTAQGGSFSLARRGDTWWVTKPLEWPANPPAVERIKNELLFLEHVTSFNVRDLAKNDQSLASYGLDKPKLTISFTSGESATAKSAPITLAIGDATKVGNNLYVLSPDGQRIHVVGRALLDSLSLPFEQVRADTLLTIPVYEARSLILQPAAPALRTYVRKEGSRWLFETPILARASKSVIDVTINELNGLRVKSFVTRNFPATLPSTAPALRVTLEGNNRRETLLIGTPVAPAPLPAGAAAPAETEYYAQFEDRSSPRAALFTVVIPTGPKSLMAKLSNAQDDLREKHILDFDSSAVSAITLHAPNQELVLQRLDPRTAQTPGTPAAARDGIWQIIRRGDTAQGPQTLPADRAAVQRLLEQLSLFEATRFLTESAATTDLENWGFNRPEREITLTLDGPPTSSVSVQIGRTTPRDPIAHARLGPASNPGASIYEVTPEILNETRLELRVWRERLLRELPPAARITALKLTDLSNSQVLLDTALDAAGNPAAPVRDAAPVQATLKHLRTLRAKSFTQDAFAERVVFAGEDRAWRYELTATISLPGGAAGEQSTTSTLLLTERGGGTQQLAGSKEYNAVFELEQPFVDALWSLIYGPRDPGPPPAPAAAASAKK
ncbi:MAG TPA: DUF4340 domain-containing protein [Opitutaceae bacterium]|nr:DUF4340 domain-containing protein [Opitutaceae bacterium]